MRTWSFAGLFDKFATLERITRPPRMGHDVDVEAGIPPGDGPPPVDGAEQLTEREAEEEVSEPRTPGRWSIHVENASPYIIGKDVSVGLKNLSDDELVGEPTPSRIPLEFRIPLDWNPNSVKFGDFPKLSCEPPFSDDEKVAIRGLIQERYESPASPKWLRDLIVGTYDWAVDLSREDADRLIAEAPMSDAEIAAYMARAERVEGGYIIHDTAADRSAAELCEVEHCLCKREWRPGFLTRAEYERAAAEHLTPVEATQRRLINGFHPDDRLNDLAAATYSSATPPADDPAGVEHPPVPPAGIPTSELLLNAAVELDYYLDKYEQSITSQINGRAFTAKLRERAAALQPNK